MYRIKYGPRKGVIVKQMRAFHENIEKIATTWNDPIQREFYQKYLDGILSDTAEYVTLEDELFDLLEISQSKADQLVVVLVVAAQRDAGNAHCLVHADMLVHHLAAGIGNA